MDYFARRISDIPGRPDMVTGKAAPDAAIGRQALDRLPRRARIMVIPQETQSLEDAVNNPEQLSESEQRRQQYAKNAIEFLKEKNADDESSAIPAKDLAEYLDCKIKAVSNYLSVGIEYGVIRKIRKSINPKRPSETCAHYFLGNACYE